MVGIPALPTDEVLYAPRRIYALENMRVDIESDSALDIYGNVYVNGNQFLSSSVIDVRTYGAKLDGTTDDTAAIQAALNAAGADTGIGPAERRGVLVFPQKSHARCIGLMVPDKVIVQANGTRFTAAGPGTIITLGAYSHLRDAALFGQGPSVAVDGAKADGFRSVIRDCTANQMAGRAFILSENCSALIDCFAQQCLQAADTLTVPTGVVEIEDTDCLIRGGEFTASRFTMSASGFAYAIAVQSTGTAYVIEDCIAEISDHGVYIAANPGHGRLMAVRADLNMGHGFVFAFGSAQVVGCLSLTNGRAATNTYDGFYLYGNGTTGLFTGCKATIDTGNTYRYGFNDASNQSAANFSSFDSSNQAGGCTTALIKVDSYAGGHVSPSVGPFGPITAGSTTWNLQTWRWVHANWFFQSVSPVNFTNFTNGVSGMRLTVCGDGNTTLVHNNAAIRMKAGANLLLAASTIYEFMLHTNGAWYQV